MPSWPHLNSSWDLEELLSSLALFWFHFLIYFQSGYLPWHSSQKLLFLLPLLFTSPTILLCCFIINLALALGFPVGSLFVPLPLCSSFCQCPHDFCAGLWNFIALVRVESSLLCYFCNYVLIVCHGIYLVLLHVDEGEKLPNSFNQRRLLVILH